MAADSSSSSSESNLSVSDESSSSSHQQQQRNRKQHAKASKTTAAAPPADEAGALDNFEISPEIKSRLKAKGITSLFPIQQKVYNPIINGDHVVAKARTGSGKTLAFLLPLFQMLHSRKGSVDPRALILVPTRELANQIASVADETVRSLKSLAIYGGASIAMQQKSLRQGVDIVIGTPGRVKDLIDRGTLNFKGIEHVILDEVDRMLDMGFKDDVQEILDIAKEASASDKEIQFLFFSATITPWVDKSARKYMKQSDNNGRKLFKVDLVGEDNLKTSKDVRHLAISCMKNSQPPVINDLIRMYSSGNDAKTIIFCQRKTEVDELAISPSLAAHKTHVLHGDIPQAKREKVIKGFKEGSINVLIATDVAARGLDIPKIDLVIQCSPPQDLESYVHRSGRTGRAGKKGIAICIYTPRETMALSRVEQFSKFKFERIKPPTNLELIDSLTGEVLKKLDEVQPKISDMVLKELEKTISSRSNDQIKSMLAKAICVAAGIMKEPSQSLLTSSKGVVTLILEITGTANSQGLFFVKLRDQVQPELVSTVQSFALSQDKKAFLFDVQESDVDKFLQQWVDSPEATLKIAEKLPKLLPNNFQNGRQGPAGQNGGGRYFNGGRGNGDRNSFRSNSRTNGNSGNFQGKRGPPSSSGGKRFGGGSSGMNGRPKTQAKRIKFS